MSFSIFQFGPGVARVAIAGNLDVATISVLRRELSNVLRVRPARVEVDLSRLGVVDASALRLLISFFEKLAAQGGLLLLFGVRDQPPAILRLLRLRGVLDRSDRPN